MLTKGGQICSASEQTQWASVTVTCTGGLRNSPGKVEARIRKVSLAINDGKAKILDNVASRVIVWLHETLEDIAAGQIVGRKDRYTLSIGCSY